MIKVSLNISSATSPMNLVPMYFEFETTRDFTNFIRESAIDILSWTFTSYGQVNNTRLGVYIKEDIDKEEYWDWSFVIKCKNIREFKPYMKMDFNEFSSLLEAHERDKKIKDILYDEN
jgi:hypothetical protein